MASSRQAHDEQTDTVRHLVSLVMDSETDNPLFQAPVKQPKVSPKPNPTNYPFLCTFITFVHKI